MTCSNFPPQPKRYVIDFIATLSVIPLCKTICDYQKGVLPDRLRSAEEERDRNKKVVKANPDARVNIHHENFLKQWWLLSWARAEMVGRSLSSADTLLVGKSRSDPFSSSSPAISDQMPRAWSFLLQMITRSVYCNPRFTGLGSLRSVRPLLSDFATPPILFLIPSRGLKNLRPIM